MGDSTRTILEMIEPSSDMIPIDEWIARLEDEPASELERPVADYLAEARGAGDA